MDDIRARHTERHWCMASSQAIDAGLYESDFPDGSHLCDALTVLAALDAANELVSILEDIADRYQSDYSIQPGGFAVWAGEKAVAAIAAHAKRKEEQQNSRLSDHPGEFHTFSLACDRCGKRGYLHLSVLGPDERFSIEPLPADVAREVLEHE